MELEDRFVSRLKRHTISTPITSKELECALGLSGAGLRDLVRRLRRNGIPIGANSDGYFYARSLEEYEDTIADLEHRAMSLLNTVEAMKGAYSEPTQIALF